MPIPALRSVKKLTFALATIALGVFAPAVSSASETTPTVSRWEPAIQAFEAADRETSPPQNGIVFVGSSSIRAWDVKKSFPDKPVINRGFGGSIASDVLDFFDRIITPYNPQIVVFYSGDNDIGRRIPPEVVAGNVRTLIERIHAEVPSVKKIILIPPKPSISRFDKWPQMKAVGEVQRAMAEQYDDVVFIDIAPAMMGEDGKPRPELFKKDNLHLSPAGYEMWDALLLPHLELDSE